MEHLTIKIRGRVQGVFFRTSAEVVARGLGLRGFIRNEADGSVYAEVEGGKKKLQEFLAWCGHGPRGAQVTAIEYDWSTAAKNFGDFRAE